MPRHGTPGEGTRRDEPERAGSRSPDHDPVDVEALDPAPRRRPTLELARVRCSCRAYVPEPIAPALRAKVEALLRSIRSGPLGSALHLRLLATTEDDPRALRGLGTYGAISGVKAFVVGAVDVGEKDLEDFGYSTERVVLGATELGLATCWLGLSFTRARFARSIEAGTWERVPAVVALGRARTGRSPPRHAGEGRRPWGELFFDGSLGTPLTPEQAGAFAPALEAVRLAPSGFNQQPWRIVRSGSAWHFLLQRSLPFGKRTVTSRLLRVADLQRVDMGIAMCHFELAARESGLCGRWTLRPPAPPGPGPEYVVTWMGA